MARSCLYTIEEEGEGERERKKAEGKRSRVRCMNANNGSVWSGVDRNFALASGCARSCAFFSVGRHTFDQGT